MKKTVGKPGQSEGGVLEKTMQFEDEKRSVARLADMIVSAAAALFRATKYIYSLCDKDFYHCDIKDVFKIVLNNMERVDTLAALGLVCDGPACGAMNSPEYEKVFSLMAYSFAVRLPLLKNAETAGEPLTDQQIKAVYDAVMERDIVNFDNAVSQSFEEMKAVARRGRDIPPYETEWYRVYLYRNIPALAQVSNRNLFLLGVADLLLAMFYMRLEEELTRELDRLS